MKLTFQPYENSKHRRGREQCIQSGGGRKSNVSSKNLNQIQMEKTREIDMFSFPVSLEFALQCRVCERHPSGLRPALSGTASCIELPSY